MKKVALLMAGGRSERLWPMSRVRMPKQFLCIADAERTMIQLTVHRLLPLIALEDIYVVTSADYVDIVHQQLPDLPMKNILAEPVGRNTAPCIAFAVAVLQERYEDAVMVVLASDHLIEQEDRFLEDLSAAADFVEEKDTLATIGITPTYPETGYGYIQYDRTGKEGKLFPVKRFVEKPNLERAKLYLQSGDYLWNSGMFVWRLSVIADHFQALLPEVYEGMQSLRKAQRANALQQVLPDVFAEFPSISIDYGIMERAEKIHVIPSRFTWLDVGNWNALPQVLGEDEKGNTLRGNTYALDSKRNIVYSETERAISLIGVEDMVVVETEDVLMVVPRDQLDGIKRMLQQLRDAQQHDRL